MHARRILIVYGSGHGQTARIARRLAGLLTAWGDEVELVHVDECPRALSLRDFDGALVGASVRYGRHQRSVERFVRAHRDALNAMPTCFVSVSGSAAGGPDERAGAQRYVDELLAETGWRPGLTATVAGATAFTKYNPLLRWVMKRISARRGGPTDTSRDYEHTDWAQVQRLGKAFAATLPAPDPARSLAPA